MRPMCPVLTRIGQWPHTYLQGSQPSVDKIGRTFLHNRPPSYLVVSISMNISYLQSKVFALVFTMDWISIYVYIYTFCPTCYSLIQLFVIYSGWSFSLYIYIWITYEYIYLYMNYFIRRKNRIIYSSSFYGGFWWACVFFWQWDTILFHLSNQQNWQNK